MKARKIILREKLRRDVVYLLNDCWDGGFFIYKFFKKQKKVHYICNTIKDWNVTSYNSDYNHVLNMIGSPRYLYENHFKLVTKEKVNQKLQEYGYDLTF